MTKDTTDKTTNQATSEQIAVIEKMTFSQMYEKYVRRGGGTIVAVVDGTGPNCELGLYVEDGNGEVIVEELGWPTDWESWVSIKFLKTFPGVRVIRA